MFEIPIDLPLKLSALAWVLGRWQGWGTVAIADSGAGQADTGEEAKFKAVIQEATAVVVGEKMKMTLRTYDGELDGDFDPMWSADEGLDRIKPGDLVSEETTYWEVDTPLAVVPAGPDEQREVRVVGSSTAGLAVLWAGVAMGPRIQLASDAVVRAPNVQSGDHFSRMFGLVGGELFWASESMPSGGEFEVETTGRLRRVASANEVNDE